MLMLAVLFFAGCVAPETPAPLASPQPLAAPPAFPSVGPVALPSIPAPVQPVSPQAPSPQVPSPLPAPSIAGVPPSQIQSERPAEILGMDYSTSPSVIESSTITKLAAIVNASKQITGFSCSGPSQCLCIMSPIAVNGVLQGYRFFPDSSGENGTYSFNVTCDFLPPVNGSYLLYGFGTAGGVRTNSVSVELLPRR